MAQRKVPWKSEWKAAGLDPGPLTPEEESLVPELVRENQDFLRKHPYRSPTKTRVPLRVWGLPLAAVAAAALFVVVPNGGSVETGTVLERMKGSEVPVLTVYRRGKTGTEKLGSGSTVKPGDVLQAAYRVAQTTQGALLSVDGGGNVTVHLAQEGRSTTLTAGPEMPLDFSYELDRAPRFEVFFLLVSPQTFDLEPVRQILKTTPWASLKPGAFGSDIRFAVLPLTKELVR